MVDASILEWIQTGGVLALMILAIAAMIRGDIVTKREFLDERADKLEWKQLYLDAIELASQATGVAEKAVQK